MAFKKILIIVLFSFLVSSLLKAAEEIMLDLKGDYLAYSYDHNQIYGENVEFKIFSYDVTSQYIKIDISSRAFYAYGNVVLKKEDVIHSGDEFLFDPTKNYGKIVNYKEEIEIAEIGEKSQEILPFENEALSKLDLLNIKKSLLYFVGQSFQITKDFEIYGFNVTIFVEGIESLGLKKFKLSGGINQRRNGFSLNKIWYTKSQGLTGRASYFFEKEKKVNSLTQINHEEHSVLKDYYGLKRQVDVMSSTTFNLKHGLDIGVTGNYNSSNLWNTHLWLNKNWKNKITTQLDFLYNKPINLEGEAWFGLRSTINAQKFGNISFLGRYEIRDQALANFSYQKTFFNKINLLLSSSYSQMRIGRDGGNSKIFLGNIDLSYHTRVFNLSTAYYLNRDLFGNQLLSQPQLRFGINPFRFYGGILSATIYNILIYNKLKRDELNQDSFSNNTVFNLSTDPIFLLRNSRLSFNVALEQFIEKEGRNFTSGGFIINANNNITKWISLEGFYSIQSRRKTENWLIEGTTSQDLSAVLKINPAARFNGWVSVSFDPKNNQFRQSFADLSLEIFSYWKLHSILQYDFVLKRINNIDLYLIREAGRFQLRFIWRSLTKQFFIELVPR